MPKPTIEQWLKAEVTTDLICAENPIVGALGAREEVFQSVLARVIAEDGESK